jgi:Ser/Thr protein kinase RdoA (MazF antagonist)
MEVICHGDYAPYNVSLIGSETVGIIDFDTAHPAPRVWDIAYAVYCWTPFKTHEYDAMGDLESQSIRAEQFCDAYGLLEAERLVLVKAMTERVQSLVDHMHNEAGNGNQAFIENIKDGHHLAYLADIQYLNDNEQYITDVVVGKKSL